MADKKITVLGDTADESLTPEEEQKIEVKIDKLLAPDAPAEKLAEPEEPEEPLPADTPKIQKKTSKILITDASEDNPKAEEPTPQAADPEPSQITPPSEATSAPPLPKKTASKVKITVSDHTDGPEAAKSTLKVEPSEPTPELAAEELPTEPLNVAIPAPEVDVTEDEPPAEATTSEESDAVLAESVGDETSDEPTKEEVATEAPAPESTPDEPSVKKYRPPDGPIPFKRAEPTEITEIVDDITKDSDHQLSDEDAAIAKAFDAKPTKRKISLPKLLPTKRLSLIFAIIVLLLVTLSIAVPQVRAVVLNLAHVRSSLSLQVLDSKTHQPLSGVTVQVGTVAVTTDQSGIATLKDLKLGKQSVSFQKSAFALATKSVFLSWKTAALKGVLLQETGTPFTFDTVDYVSGQPVAGVQASSGSSTAQADNKGRINLLLDEAQAKSKTVTFVASGYRSLTLPLPADSSKPANVALVPSQQEVYVSKQAGRYNLYKASVDGQDTTLLLAGSGNETGQIDLVVSNDATQAALISTRDSQKDKAGYLLQTLSLVSVANGATATLDHGQQIDVIGWFGSRLVYTMLKADAATTDPARYQLVSYDTSSKKSSVLDSANDFNDVAVAKGMIYYASSNHASGGASQLVSIKPDGSAKQTLLSSEVTGILKSDYTDFLFMTSSSYYAYKIGGAKPTVTNSTYSGNGQLYVDSPDGKNSVWVNKDQHKLTLHNNATGVEKVLLTDSDLAYPLRWLNNSTVIYRLSNPNIASDYVIGVNGGTAKKLATVVDTTGLKLWRD